MKNTRKFISSCVLVVAVVTACQSGGSTTTSKTLVMAVDDIPAGLDWDGPSVSLPTSHFGMNNLYETLVEYPVTYNVDGSASAAIGTFKGELADSWSQAGLVWTFKLRQGVKSCAGNELTADDVVYTLARDKSVTGQSPVGWFIMNVAGVFDAKPLAPNATAADKQLNGEVTKIDKYTVQIKQISPNLNFLPALALFSASIIDSTEMKKHTTTADPWAHTWADTTGAAGFAPWCLESWTKGSQFVVKRNPSWNIPPIPAYDRVTELKIPSGSDRVTALETGKVDEAQGLTAKQFADLAKQSGIKVAAIHGSDTLFLNLNFKTPPFNNTLLREAIAYAIPYDQVIQNGYSGLATKWDSVVPSDCAGFRPAATTYTYDLTKAKALLAQAGYPNGAGLQKYASSFQLSYAIERQEQLQPVATIISASLTQLNIPLTLNPLPDSEIGRRTIVTQDLPMGLNDNTSPNIPDCGFGLQVMVTPRELGGAADVTNYNSPAVNNLWLNEAKVEADPQKRLQLILQATDVAMKDVAFVPIVEVPTSFAHKDSITGFFYMPGDFIRLRYLRPVGPKYNAAGSAA